MQQVLERGGEATVKSEEGGWTGNKSRRARMRRGGWDATNLTRKRRSTNHANLRPNDAKHFPKRLR